MGRKQYGPGESKEVMYHFGARIGTKLAPNRRRAFQTARDSPVALLKFYDAIKSKWRRNGGVLLEWLCISYKRCAYITTTGTLDVKLRTYF
jgi:hypothetical protein